MIHAYNSLVLCFFFLLFTFTRSCLHRPFLFLLLIVLLALLIKILLN
jgi:hypothetical protein